MASKAGGLTFAAVGHQASWSQIARLVGALRADGSEPSMQRLRETVPWIPPRVAMRAQFRSILGHSAEGLYVETFLDPERLGASELRQNLRKVNAAIQCAAREGAEVVTLGGFSSIIVESSAKPTVLPDVALTTGNTLTSYFVLRGVEAALHSVGRELRDCNLGIIGASGDIGSACVNVFGSAVKQMFVSARNAGRLRKQQEDWRSVGIATTRAEENTALLEQCDVVIAAASMLEPELDVSVCGRDVIVCDVGYPKNVKTSGQARVFWGGLGSVEGGWNVQSGVAREFYELGGRGVLHGCLLEGVVLGLEHRKESYSQGRGAITRQRVLEMGSMAERHGIRVSPPMNQEGVWG